MLKQANLSFSVTAQANGNDTNAIQFSTQDKKTAKLIFTIKEGKEPLNLTDIDGEITLVMQDKSRFVDKTKVTKPLDGIIEYTLTQEQIRHAGRAQGEVVLKARDGSSVGGFRFNFTIKKALMDEDLGPVKDFYIQDLEAVKQDVKKKAEVTASELNNLTTELATIAGNLEEEYQNKAYTVDEKLADVQATVTDLRKNGTGIDAQARQEVQEIKYYVSVDSFPKLAPETNDQPRLQRFVNYLEVAKKTGFIMSGEYLLNSPLLLGNNVSVILDRNAILIRNHTGGGSSAATIRNKNLSSTNRNSNISISGGVIKAKDNTKTGKHLVFWGVDGLKLSGLKTRETYGDWTTLFRDCTDVMGNSLDIDTVVGDIYTDGIHIVGGTGYVFSDCIVKSGDDCFSFTVETPEDTDINGITITNCNLTTRRSSVIKMTTKPGTTNTIKNIKISNISSKGGTMGLGESIIIKDEENAGRISDITLKDVTVDCSQGAGVGLRLQGVNRIKGNIEIIRPQGKGADISYCNDWELKLRVDSPRATNVNGISLNNVDDFELTPEVVNATLHGVAVGAADSPVTNGRIINGKTKNSANTGIRLVNAVGVDVVNHMCINDTNGIIEDGGNVNNYNTISNNDVRAVLNTKIAINGATSKVRANKGYITENRSSFQLGGNSTSVVVNHGLSVAPSSHGIVITPRSSFGAATKWWISNVTATSFTFNVDNAPGAVVDLSFEANAPKNI